MRKVALSVIVTTLAIGVAPLAAQEVPTPPEAPRSPRPPRAARTPRAPRTPEAPRTWYGNSDGVAKIDTVVAFSSDGTVELSLVAGTMKLSTWDRNQVRVVATTSGPPSLQFDASNSHMSLEQVKSGYNSDRDNLGSATYDVTVPTGSRATLSAVSGNINASGLRGRVEVSNVSGDVNVRDVGSSLSVEGVSGQIVLANVGGDARVENVSGRVSLAGAGGSVTIETVSGGVAISGIKGTRVHVTSVSGGIDFAGPVNGSGRYDFETHSGRTNLKLSSNANATISVETFSGSVSNDYPGANRRRSSDPDDDTTVYEYVIGSGAGHVRAETFSGSVHISQGNP